MAVDALVAELSGLGVLLRIEGERLAFDAPTGVITDDLLARMRAEREGLLAILRGGATPEPVAHGPVVVDAVGDCRADLAGCPSCGGGPLAEDADGLRCPRCGRLSWVESDGGGLVRCDLAGADCVDPDSVPICPGCGRWCDVLTLADAWRCSRCDPEADNRKRATLRLLSLVGRWRGCPETSDRRAVR